jgi:hypothetical protein
MSCATLRSRFDRRQPVWTNSLPHFLAGIFAAALISAMLKLWRL